MLDMSLILKNNLFWRAHASASALSWTLSCDWRSGSQPDWSQAFPTFTLFAVSVIEDSLALRNSSLNECTLALLLFPCVLSHLLDLIHRSMQMNPPNDSVPLLFSVHNLSFAVPREAAFPLAQKMKWEVSCKKNIFQEQMMDVVLISWTNLWKKARMMPRLFFPAFP